MNEQSSDVNTDEFRPRPIDEKILRELIKGKNSDDPWGRTSPGIISSNLDVTSQHVINRLQILAAAGYVRKLDRGIYELTEKGIEKTEAASDE